MVWRGGLRENFAGGGVDLEWEGWKYFRKRWRGGVGGALQKRIVEKIDRGCDPKKNYAQTNTHRTHRGQ